MKYSAEIFELAEERLEKKREEVREARARELEEIYEQYPRLREIDREIKDVSLFVLHKLASEPGADIIKDADKRASLVVEREAIVAKGKLDAKLFEPVFFCDKCHDTGVECGGYAMCSCKKEEAMKVAARNAGMGDLILPSFNDFDLRFYSDEVGKKNASNRKIAECILAAARSFSDGGNALIRGSAGLGKTFTAECVANEWMQNGKIVSYYSASKLFLILNEHVFNRKDTREDTQSQLDLIYGSDLLIIDDLGTEFRNSFTESMFFNILETRLRNKKSMIVTTNLKAEDIMDIYSERVLSRIDGYFELWNFYGSDIRGKKRNV